MWGMIGGLMAAGVGIGLVIAFIVVVPTVIFTLPYAAWLGWNSGRNGVPEDAGKGKPLFYQAKNASKLYRSWITHTPHNIINW